MDNKEVDKLFRKILWGNVLCAACFIVACYFAYHKNIYNEIIFLALVYFKDADINSIMLKIEREKERLEKESRERLQRVKDRIYE